MRHASSRRAVLWIVAICALAAAALLASPARAAGIIVNSPLDTTIAGDGACTLREAVGNANSNSDSTGGDCAAGSGADLISFAIASGPQTITLASVLPTITGPTTINGASQPGYTGAPLITLFANGLSGTILTAQASGVAISDLIISSAPGTALRLVNADDASITRVNVAWAGTGQSGTGVLVDTGSDRVTLREIVATRRREGVSVTGGSDFQLLDSDLTGSGADTGDWALDVIGLTAGSIPGGLRVAGTSFGNSSTGVRLQNMAGLVIGDNLTAGVTVDLSDGGIDTLTTVSSNPLLLTNIDNSSLADLDLGWSATSSRTGTGLSLSSGNDNITIQNVRVGLRQTGITATQGSDLRVLGSNLSDSGQDQNTPALYLNQIGAVSLPGGVLVADNSFTNSWGIRINSMPNLIISDGSVAGTQIDLTDAAGSHTLTSATGTALWLNNTDNLLVQLVDLSYPTTSRTGTAIYVENGSDTVTIRDSQLRNRTRGISVNGGRDVQLLSNDLTNTGVDANTPALLLSAVGKILLPDGVQVADNIFTNSGFGLRVNNTPNLTISDGSVAGTDIDVTDAAGNHTLSSAGTAIWLNNADGTTIANVDVGWANSVGGSRSGIGIYVENGSDTVTVRDSQIRNRATGISVNGGRDVQVLNNDLTNTGVDANSPALLLSAVGKILLPDGVAVADNSFTNSGFGLRVSSTPNLTISDGSVAGTDIDVTDAAGNHTLSSAGTAIWLNNADNTTIASVDVGWANSLGGSRNGTGIYVENGSDTVTVRDSQIRNRATGISVNGGRDVQVLNNDLTNSGNDPNSPALLLNGVGKILLPDGVAVADNRFTNSGMALRITSTPNLTISDGSLAGTDIDMTDAAGNHTANTALYAIWLNNADGTTIANLDVSWANSLGSSRNGIGIYVENGSDTVTVRDSQIRNRATGISVNGGRDVQVLNNDLTNSGNDQNSPALLLSAVGKILLPDGVQVADNIFTNSSAALRINSTPNLTISDGSVAGTDIDMTDAAGNHTANTATYAIWLNNADGTTIANVDVGWANSLAGSRNGYGIYLETGNDNVTIRDSQARNRSTSISVNGGSDVRVLNNNLGNSGTGVDNPALYLNQIGSVGLPGGVQVADNDFSDGGYGVSLLNMANLIVSDGSVAGTHIDLTNAAGVHTLRSVTDMPLIIRHNVDTTSISKLDLSWAASAITGRSGTGIWIGTISGNSNSGLTFSDLVIAGRTTGISVRNAPSAAISCSVFLNNSEGVNAANINPDPNLTLTNNLLQANATAVVWNVASPTLSAANNYWGAASGPTNLGGTGNGYSGGVSASPFLTSPAGCTSLPSDPPPPIISDPAASFVVTTNSDVSDGDTSSIANLVAGPGADGAISLREAITAANNTPGADTIGFAIGSGPQTIYLSAVLPALTGQLTINGTSQPITINAQGLTGTILTVQAAGSILRDFAVTNAQTAAVRVTNADNVELRNLVLSWGNVGARRGTGIIIEGGSDNVLVDGVTISRRSDGINTSGGTGLQIRNSSLTDNNNALNLNSLSASGLSIQANSYAASSTGIRITTASGLVISDGSVAGTNIDLRDSGGNQTLTSASSYALYLADVDDSSVRNVNLGWNGLPSGRSGSGLYATSNSDRLLVQNISATRRGTGVSISNGVDAQVRDSNLSDSGLSLYLENITAGTLPGGVLVQGNSYALSTDGVRLVGLRNLVISDGSVAGTNVDLRDSGGNQTMGSVSGRTLWLSNTDDSSVRNVSLSWTGAPTGRSGTGLQADTASDRLLVQGISAARRVNGVYISGGADQQVRDSNLGDNGQALYFESITIGTLPGGVGISGNSYSGSDNAVRFHNMRNLVISDGSVAGTNVDLRDSGGNQTMGSVSNYPLWLWNVDDSSVRNVNLGWSGAPTGRSGTGLYASNVSDRLLVQGISVTRRSNGVSISGGADQQVRNSNLGDNDQALYFDGVTIGTLPGGVGISGNSYSGSDNAVRFHNMRNLVISDGSVAGTNVDLRDTGGNQTMGGATGRALWLWNVDDSSVGNVNLSWTAGPSPSGIGLQADNGSDRLLVQGITANRRSYGVYVVGASDVQVRDSNLRNNTYNLWLESVTPGALTGGVRVAGNDYTNSEFTAQRAITLNSLRDQVIAAGPVAGLTIDLRDGGGAQTVGNANTAILLQNVDTSVVDGVNLSWAGPSRGGVGLFAVSSDNTVIRNIVATNRGTGIIAASSANLDALNNDLSNNTLGLDMQSVSGADIAGNTFTGSNQAIRLASLSGPVLGAGAGLTTVAGTVIELNNVSNATLSGIDLSYNGPSRQGTGVYIWGASSNNITIQGSRFVNRAVGVSFANNGSTFSLSCNYFVNNTTGVQAGQVNSNEGPTGLTMANNRFQGNNLAISNPNRWSGSAWTVPAPLVNAENNYWGALSGPAALGGSGDSSFGNVDAAPFSAYAASCVNSPPVVSSGGPYSVNEGGSLGLNALATSDADQPTSALLFQWDLDGDSLRGESGAAATRGEENGAVTLFSAADLDGDALWNAELAVIDDSNVPVVQSVPINVLNVPPSFEAGANATAVNGAFSRSGIAFIDPGTPDLHTVDVTWGDGDTDSFSLAVGDRSFSLSHTYATAGLYTVQVTLSDDDGGQTVDSFLIDSVYNDPPTISDIADTSTDEDAPAGPLAFTIDDPQTAAADLDVTVASSNSTLVPNTNIALGGAGASRSLTITPAADLSGTSTITVTVSDGTLSVSDSFVLTVSPVNDAPALDPLGSLTIAEDAGPQTVNLADIADGDPELSQGLTVSATSDNLALIANPTVSYSSPDATGSLSFAPAANASGTATITVRVTDDGGSSAPNVNFVERSFTVTVTPVNDAPTLGTIDSLTIAEDAGPQSVSLAGIADGDPELSQNLTVTATSDNPALIANPTVSYSSPDATGSLSFAPAANASGTATITVRVTDDGGSSAPDINLVERSLLITVTPVNDAPTAISLSGSGIAENLPANTLVGILGATDNDGGPTYSYSLVSGAGDSGNSSFAIVGDELRSAAVFDYEAQSSYSIQVEVSDGNGGSFAQPLTINILDGTVAPTITSAAPADGQYGQAYSHSFTADGEPAASFSVSGGALPPGLSLNAGGLLSGTPTQAGTFSGITVTANNGVNPAATQTFTIVVSPAALSVTADAQSKVYGAANPALTYTATGFVNGDTAAVLSGALATTATAASGVGSYPITLGSLAAANYTISYTAGTLTITPAALTVVADDQTKRYGQANPALTFSATGFVLGEDAASALTGALATTATPASPVGSYPITQGTLAAANYTISFSGADLTIDPAALSVTADPQTKSYGQANPALTFTASGFVLGEDASSALTGALATTATPASPVGSYPITQGTLAAANYTISFTSSNLNVTTATLTISADPQSKSYGQANPALTYSASGFVNGDTAAILTGALATTATSTSGVGLYPITQGTLAANANYGISFSGADLTVSPAALSVTADPQTKLYGQANPALTFSAGGFVLGEDAASALTGALATTATTASGVGTYPISLGTLAAANYSLSFTGGTLTVTPAPLSVVADAKARAFGDPNPPLTFSASGFVNGDTPATALTGELATTATVASPAGSYPITIGSLAAANYTISFTDGTLTIGSAVLTVVADPQTKVYGAPNPALTYTVTGFVNGDTPAILTGGLATTATTASGVGSYAITLGDLAAANYSISYTGATLTITPAALTVVADDQTKVYGAANPALTYTVTGFVNGDTPATALTGALATPATAASGVGSYPITLGDLAAANYSIGYTGATLTITPAALTVVADDQTKVYGAANPALTFSASGFVNGDTPATALTGELATTATVASPAGSYPITIGSLAAANYTISFTDGTLTIGSAVLTVVADPQTKGYGAPNPPLTYTVTGFVNGDTPAILTGGLATTATTASGVGSYAITLGDLAAANYSISYTAGTLTITPAALTVVADDQTKVYGAANPALTFSASGFVNGDTAASALTGELATTATTASGAGSYPITLGSLAAANYSIGFTDGTLTVTAATLTATADSQTRIFGQPNPALTISYSGFVNGDDASDLEAPPTASTTASTTSPVGSYPITLGGGSDDNYTLIYVDGTLTITPTGQTPCTGDALTALLASNAAVIELDGACRYQLGAQGAANGHLINLFNRRDLTIDGNGAVIEPTGAIRYGMIAVIDSQNITIKDLTLAGGQAVGLSSQLGGRGGAVLLYNSANVTIDGVRFLDNRGTLGGALSTYGGSTTVVNSVFANSQASEAGAAIYAQGPLIVRHSTITDGAANPKEAIFAWDTLSVQSSIIANHAVGLAVAGGPSKPASEDYNLFSAIVQRQKIYNRGAQIGGGAHSFSAPNVNAQFVDPAGGNYRLKVDAAAIDRGLTPALAPLDADGRTRPFGGTGVDIGAYEFQGDRSLRVIKLAPHWVPVDTTFTITLIVANNGGATLSGLELRDTLPAGLSFVGGLAPNATLDGPDIRWDLGSLAPGQSLSLTYQARVSQTVASDDYAVVRTSDGGILARGPAVTITATPTIVTSLSQAARSFNVGRDDFSFANWRDPAANVDLSAAHMYLIYGPGVCARDTGASPASCVLTAPAARQLASLQQLVGSGRGFGMAATSLALFKGWALADGSQTPADLQPGALVGADLLRYQELDQLIALYQAARLSPPPTAGGDATVTDGTVAGLLGFLQSNGFDGPANDDAYTLSVRGADGRGVALVPYALEARGGGIYRLYVYDPDAPGDRERFVTIDANAGTWDYTGAGSPAQSYSGDAQSRSMALRSLSVDTALPRSCGFCALEPGAQGGGVVFTLNGPGRMLITDAQGRRFGYDPASGAFINEIPGATLDALDGGAGAGQPLVLRMPPGSTYTVAAFSADGTPTSADLTITAPGMVVGLSPLQLSGAGDPALVQIDPATRQIGFTANSADQREMDLTLAVEAPDGNSYSFTMTDVTLQPGRSLSLGFDDEAEQLTIRDTNGKSPRYNMLLTRVEPGGTTQTVQRNNITSSRGAGAIISLSGWSGSGWPPTTVIMHRLSMPLL